MNGTSTRNAIRGFGGYNKSEFNFQKHSGKSANDFSEQDRSAKQWAGVNPLNNPAAVAPSEQPLRFKINQVNDWRERTLALPVPGQVEGGMPRLGYTSADTSLLQWKLHHGLGNNDPSLRGLLQEQRLAPSVRADWQWQPEPFLHSDIGVPSTLRQNMMETPTTPFQYRRHAVRRGRHDHHNLKEHHTPAFHNHSHTATGTHPTSGMPPHPMMSGFRATRGPLERPLLLSDLPQPPQPVPIL
jgi:hypothetical protein